MPKRVFGICLCPPLLFLCITLGTSAWAQMTSDQALQLGKDLANSQTDANRNMTKNPSAGGVQGTAGVPGYGNAAQQSTYYQNGQGNTNAPGTAKMVECANASSENLGGYAGKPCDAINFLSQNPQNRPKVVVGKDDPMVKGSGDITSGYTKNPGSLPGGIGMGGKTGQQCVTQTVPGKPIWEDQYCYGDGGLESKKCTYGWVINVDQNTFYSCEMSSNWLQSTTCDIKRNITVDADYNYQCLQSPLRTEQQQCDKYLVVTCNPAGDGCDAGGIVPQSWAGDMRTTFGPVGGGTYALDFGTRGDNYWGTGTYDKTLSFGISNKAAITQFTLVQSQYDDWIWIKLNGVNVYAPAGEIYMKQVPGRGGGLQVWANNRYVGPVDRGRNWIDNINVDLRPYLVNGTNTLWIRTIVGDKGESFTRILTRQQCPVNCTDGWVNQCTTLEQQSQ